MWSFLAGAISGVLSVVLFVIVNAVRAERFLPQLIQLFQLMRLHLGYNSVIAARTGPYGWSIEVNCFGCKGVTVIPKNAVEFKCSSCGKPFRQTGNAAGGTGCNAVGVTTEPSK